MKEIPLYKKGVEICRIIVDDEDFDWASRGNRWQPRTRVNKDGAISFYAVRGISQGSRKFPKKFYLLHRLILERKLGRELLANEISDHADRDSLNCCRYNLRLATKSQNNTNGLVFSKGASKYRGVTVKSGGRFQAAISANCRKIHLGRFGTEEEAARAYDRAASEVYGEFARLNFPTEVSTNA